MDTAVGVAVEAAEVAAEAAADVAVATEDDELTMVPEESRYQLAAGSPRHSPTVTPL